MAEIVFIFVIIYFVYVVNTAVVRAKEKKEEANESAIPPNISVPETKNTETVKVKAEKVVTKPVKKPIAKKATTKKSTTTTIITKKATTKKTVKKVAVEKTNMPTGKLRNPATGETDNIANNYRMLRKWIKEALVVEGLLEKIYKTSELDDAVRLDINNALNELMKMDKYQ